MTLREKLIDFIWNCNYLSDTQKDLLDIAIKSYFENLWSELEAKNIHKDIEIDGLLRQIKELEEKVNENLENILTRVINEVFGLKMKDLVPNDRLKIDKIIEEVKNDG